LREQASALSEGIPANYSATTLDGHRISAYISDRLAAYLEDLQQLCAIECYTAHKQGVDEAGTWVHGWATRRGWTVVEKHDSRVGDTIIIKTPGGTPRGLKVLLVAHLDTVYPIGTAKSKLRRRDDILMAPGIADDKSGLLSGLYAMAALEDLGNLGSFAEICLVCGGDEETDMRVSGAVLHDIALSYDLALILEAARPNGDIVSERKGVADLLLEVHGRAAHAGVDPGKGANAIVSLSQQVAALHRLNGMRHGVTVNVGTIQGGSAINVVPDYAAAMIDVRFSSLEDKPAIEDAITSSMRELTLPGTKSTIKSNWIPPMARTTKNAMLASKAQECARALGFELTDVATGGVSYANLLAGQGLPVLDGLGPIGGDDHNKKKEYILHSSIVPRTALLGLLLLTLSRQGDNK